jgi:hypothetical protein
MSWLVPAFGGLTILDRPSAIDGRIELVDPATCTVIDSARLLDRSFVISIAPGQRTHLEVIDESPGQVGG